MNAIQRKLKKLEKTGARKETIERAGQFRTDGAAWHGWTCGSDLVWLLATLGLPRKRLREVLDAVVNQARKWDNSAAGEEQVRSVGRAAKYADQSAEWAENEAEAYWAAIDAEGAAEWADIATERAAEAAEDAGVMTYNDAQAALADLVRREVPWEEVKDL